MNFREHTLRFDCGGDSLIGVLTRPDQVLWPPALVVVGGPQYRAGSHRQFVRLARMLAFHGIPVMRFDHRGAGDSTGMTRSFDEISADIAAAIDVLCSTTGSRRVVLLGLCDAASAALLYMHDQGDAQVAGLCLLNPWVRSAPTLQRTLLKHYYVERLQQREFWSKLLRGGVRLSALSDLSRQIGSLTSIVRPTSNESFQSKMASGLARSAGPVLLVLSGRDYTAREFTEYTSGDSRWGALLAASRVTRRELRDADHTFSRPGDKALLAQLVLGWWTSAFEPRACNVATVTSS